MKKAKQKRQTISVTMNVDFIPSFIPEWTLNV